MLHNGSSRRILMQKGLLAGVCIARSAPVFIASEA
jgi:hypothetical protein